MFVRAAHIRPFIERLRELDDDDHDRSGWRDDVDQCIALLRPIAARMQAGDVVVEQLDKLRLSGNPGRAAKLIACLETRTPWVLAAAAAVDGVVGAGILLWGVAFADPERYDWAPPVGWMLMGGGLATFLFVRHRFALPRSIRDRVPRVRL